MGTVSLCHFSPQIQEQVQQSGAGVSPVLLLTAAPAPDEYTCEMYLSAYATTPGDFLS
jgi:hypothetical protein